jgi:uncharacterized RDD family membrane protein YckC
VTGPDGRREPLPPYGKADLTLRGLARGFDFSVALVLGLAAPFVVGPLLAAGYLAVADGLLHGQSPGKRLFGVRVVLPQRRVSASFAESLQRNAPFAVVALCWALPLLWPVFVLVGLPVVAVEAWRTWREPLGLRYGDVFADTQVVDAKGMVSDPVTEQLRAVAPAPPGQAARTAVEPPGFRQSPPAC